MSAANFLRNLFSFLLVYFFYLFFFSYVSFLYLVFLFFAFTHFLCILFKLFLIYSHVCDLFSSLECTMKGSLIPLLLVLASSSDAMSMKSSAILICHPYHKPFWHPVLEPLVCKFEKLLLLQNHSSHGSMD